MAHFRIQAEGFCRVQTFQKQITFRKPKGGCQNYGPFLGPYYNTAPNI